MIYAFAEYEFDAVRLELRRRGAVVKAEPLSLRVLASLVRSAGRLVTKEELTADVWGGRSVGDNVITLSMARLRKALNDRRNGREYIVTVHGLGYRFVCPVIARGERAFASGPSIVCDVAPPSVGRASVLAELRQCVGEAQLGRGRLCVLMGEPGIGKTHVLSVLSEELTKAGAQVAWGFCRESGSTPPLYPWLQLLRRLFDAIPEDEVADVLGPSVRELRQLLSLGEASPPRADAEGGPGLRDISIISRAFMRASESAPWVLVLEDLHRADAASLEVLSLLVDEVARSRILVLATVRSLATGRAVRPSTALPYILGHQNAERFVLRHLSEAEVAEYVAATLSYPSERLAGAVYAKSQGNPFFMAELVRQLRREEKIDPDQLTLPNVALDIIRQHVAALDPDTRSFLTAASVIGVQFDMTLLEAVAGLPTDALALALDGALAADLLVAVPDFRATFAFRHELVRSVLYEAIPPMERRRRHLDIALAMERRALEGHETVPVSELADHFYAALPATDLEKTVRYCNQAARAACNSFANTDVARHMRQALAALALIPSPPLPLRMALLLRLAMYTRGSAPDIFIKSIGEVVRLAYEAGDAKMLVRGARMHHAHPELSALPGATEALEHVLTLVGDGQPVLRASALATLATAPPRAFSAAASRAAIDEAEALARSAERPNGLQIALVCKLFVDGCPDVDTANVTLELERLFAKDPRRGAMSPIFIAMQRIMHALQRGELNVLNTAIDGGLARARAVRHPEVAWHFERFRAIVKINAGACAEGMSLLSELHERTEARTLLGAATFCAFDRLVVLAELGVEPVVDDALRRALAYQPSDPPGVWALKVRALVAAGLVDEARSSLAAVPPSRLADLPHDSQYLGTLGHLVRAALTAGMDAYLEALDPLLAPYENYFAGAASMLCDGSFAQLRGMLAAARGNPKEGRMLLERGFVRNERAGFLIRAVESRLELAKLLRIKDKEAARRLSLEARSMSEQLVLPQLARRASILLSELAVDPMSGRHV